MSPSERLKQRLCLTAKLINVATYKYAVDTGTTWAKLMSLPADKYEQERASYFQLAVGNQMAATITACSTARGYEELVNIPMLTEHMRDAPFGQS
jgi:hypothetical protein